MLHAAHETHFFPLIFALLERIKKKKKKNLHSRGFGERPSRRASARTGDRNNIASAKMHKTLHTKLHVSPLCDNPEKHGAKVQVQQGTHWWRSEGPGWLRTSRWPWCCPSCRPGTTAGRPCCPGCRYSSPPWPCVTAGKHLPQSCGKPQTQSHYGPCGAAASPPERPAAAGKN